MSLKMEFIERATAPGAKLAPLCREFGISRQTAYKWLKRFKEQGFEGLEEQSRRPSGSPLAFAEEVVLAVLEQRDRHPSWGAKKLFEVLRRRFGEKAPSVATVARLLKRSGRVRERRARQHISVVERAPTVVAAACNELWTVDFKGWWRTRDGERCEPLTVRDAFSRYVLTVRLTTTGVAEVLPIFEELFRKHGLPKAIQTDNGSPFVCSRARGGLSRLSAWWVSHGIQHIRSRAGCPQDNGAHERMHRDISRDVERFPATTPKEQQRELDRWRQEFNHVRPHEALSGRTPAELFRRSERHYGAPPPPQYPAAELIRRVCQNGCIRIDDENYFVSMSLGGHDVGLETLGDGIRYRVKFYDVDCAELEVAPVATAERLSAQAATSPAATPRREPLRGAKASTCSRGGVLDGAASARTAGSKNRAGDFKKESEKAA